MPRGVVVVLLLSFSGAVYVVAFGRIAVTLPIALVAEFFVGTQRYRVVYHTKFIVRVAVVTVSRLPKTVMGIVFTGLS